MKRPILLPLVPLYAAGHALQNAFAPAPRRLTRPVVSVGSLSAGGAGKTPVVLALATLLRSHGIAVDVLTRGYGRTSTRPEQVDPSGPATRFGDEPLLLAQTGVQPGLNVFVAPNRYQAGQLAESLYPSTQLHLLDDGFQHRRLARSLDLVLVTAEDLADHLIPAGNLREPLSAVRRADILILRTNEAEALTPTLRLHTQAPIWLIQRTISIPPALAFSPVAFCALGRPDAFFADVTQALRPKGLTLAGTLIFPDHHPYTFQNIRALRHVAAKARASAFLTTAKDAVKLTPALLRALTEEIPLHIAGLTVTFQEEAAVWRALQPLVETPNPPIMRK